MDRAQASSIAVSVAGHAALFGLMALAVGRAGAPPMPAPMEVSFVEDVALAASSPTPAASPPEQGMAPLAGPPEDADTRPQPPLARPVPAPQPSASRRAETQPPRPSPASRPTERPAERPRRSLIGDDLLKGIGRDPSTSTSRQAPAATMSNRAAADIASAIVRQVQPCADRQVYPGPGAERIVTTLNLRLNRNGSLAAPPRMMRQSGVDEENRRYAQRVADLAIRSFVECAPLRGLPSELYDVPRGWSNFTMNYRLPG